MKKNLFLLTAIVSITLAMNAMAQVPSYIPVNGLQAWYPFNGNANDESGNNKHLTVTGAQLSTDRFGNLNSSYSFNGISDYLSRNLLTAVEFTYSVWANFDTIDGNHQTLISKGDAADLNGGLSLSYNDNGSGLTTVGISYVSPNVSLSNFIKINFIPKQNTWYHIAISKQGSIYSIYVNGLLNSRTNFNTPTGTYGKLGIGASWVGPAGGNYWYYFFDGRLDDIGVWDRVLDSIEVRQLYMASCTTPANPTITALGSTTFCQGDSITLYNPSVYSLFQWQKNNKNIAGANFNNYSANSSGTYRCVISNACSTVTTNAISVTRIALASVSISAGGPLNFCLGGSVTLTATNPGPGYTYQWFKGDISIPGATSLTYVAYSSGTYKIAITNSSGCVRHSKTKKVTVIYCKNGSAPTLQDIPQSNVNVYPNPISNSFTFELDEDVSGSATVTLLNTLGQEVFENKSEIEKGQPIENLFINNKLNDGLYILRIKVNEKMFSSKVIIK